MEAARQCPFDTLPHELVAIAVGFACAGGSGGARGFALTCRRYRECAMKAIREEVQRSMDAALASTSASQEFRLAYRAIIGIVIAHDLRAAVIVRNTTITVQSAYDFITVYAECAGHAFTISSTSGGDMFTCGSGGDLRFKLPSVVVRLLECEEASAIFHALHAACQTVAMAAGQVLSRPELAYVAWSSERGFCRTDGLYSRACWYDKAGWSRVIGGKDRRSA